MVLGHPQRAPHRLPRPAIPQTACHERSR
jgi:hypothetical protein